VTRAAAEPSDKLDGGSHAKAAVRLELRLLTLTALIERRIAQRFREEFDTTLPRFDFLAALDRNGELSLGEISRLLMVSNGNVTGIVDRLVSDGFVVRSQRNGDRRTSFVRLTTAGRAAFAEMSAAHEGWIDRLFGAVSEREAEQISAKLRSFRSDWESET